MFEANSSFSSLKSIERFYVSLINKEPDAALKLQLRNEMTLRKAEFRAAKYQERYTTYGPNMQFKREG